MLLNESDTPTREDLAVQTARNFFERMSNGDMDGVRELLDSSFAMAVSGNYRFTDIADFIAFSRQRNGGVRKAPEGYDVCRTEEGVAVYCYGTMSGNWVDGSPFEGVRFIDRFLIRGTKILDLKVWSDMAEFRPRPEAE